MGWANEPPEKVGEAAQHFYVSTYVACRVFGPLRGGFLIPRPMGVVGDYNRV